MKIAVLGLGFLGTTIYDVLKKEHDVIGITRDNYDKHIGEEFDVFINSDGNSRKYYANENPKEDFRLSVLSVYDSIFDFKFGKYIYISSVDIWEDGHYGYHKRLAENIIESNTSNYLFVRCGAIIGKGMKKGIFWDIVNNEALFVTPDSKIQFITDTDIAIMLKEMLGAAFSEVTLTSKNSITIQDIYKLLNLEVMKIRVDAKNINYEYKKSVFIVSKTCEQYINDVI